MGIDVYYQLIELFFGGSCTVVTHRNSTADVRPMWLLQKFLGGHVGPPYFGNSYIFQAAELAIEWLSETDMLLISMVSLKMLMLFLFYFFFF